MGFFSRSGPQIREVMAALRTWHSEWKGAQQQIMAAFDDLKAQLDAGATNAKGLLDTVNRVSADLAAQNQRIADLTKQLQTAGPTEQQLQDLSAEAAQTAEALNQATSILNHADPAQAAPTS